MSHRIKSALGIAAAAAIISANSADAQTPASDTIRIGYQKSSTLTAILKTNGELEKALAPLGVRISWHEFTSGLPLLEAINTGNVDFGCRRRWIPCRCSRRPPAPSSPISRKKPPRRPPRRSWWPRKSPIRTVADLKGKKVAVTKGAGSHFLLLAALAKAGLSFKDISPAYLTPADGRTAFIGGNVDAWVAWDHSSPARSASPMRG